MYPFLHRCCLQVVAIANDITFNSGAFGPREDAMFRAVTEHALQQKLPLVYLAANSGARVGLANEVKQCLQVILHRPIWLCVRQIVLLLPKASYACSRKVRAVLALSMSACAQVHAMPNLPTACSLSFCSNMHMPCRGRALCVCRLHEESAGESMLLQLLYLQSTGKLILCFIHKSPFSACC